MRPVITLFTRPGCTLCDSAKFVIKKAGRRATFDYREVDISATGQQKWLELYTNDIPVIHLGDKEIFRHRVSEKDLLAALNVTEN